jgi:energy-coupling factor transport system permease protein
LIFYLLVLATLIGSLLQSGVTPSTLARNFRPIAILVLITFLYHILFYGGETPAIITVLGFSVYQGAVYNAVFFSLRLVLFISVAFLMTLTNSPSELAEALAMMLKPLKRVGVPVHDLALILFIAIRFVPILFEEFTAIRNAQMIRGVAFTGSFVSRLKKTTYIILPVFVSAIGRADDLALAIEARGYKSGRNRTFYSHSRIGKKEAWFMLLSSLAVVLVFYITR